MDAIVADKSDGSAAQRAGMPRVSVVTIFLNGATYIEEAIDSVIAQTMTEWELLLVDDGSTDASTRIAQDYAARYPGKIRYLEHPGHVNRGMSASRNLGIRNARAPLLAFIDADDVWLPGKLAGQVAILDSHPDVGMVCGSVTYWRSWTGGADRLVRTGPVQDRIVSPPETLGRMYPFGRANAPCPSDLMVRTSVAAAVGYFEEHFTGQRQAFEDQGFLSKVYMEAPVWFASDNWLKYREHPESCLISVKRAGKYDEMKLYFLSWFEKYLKTRPNADPGAWKALNRAMWRFRHPALYWIWRFPVRAARKLWRTIGGTDPLAFR